MKLNKKHKRFISIAIDVIGIISILTIWGIVASGYLQGSI